MLLYSRALRIRVSCFETEADSTGCYQVNNKFGRLLKAANNDEIILAVAIFARDYTSTAAETNTVVNIRNHSLYLYAFNLENTFFQFFLEIAVSAEYIYALSVWKLFFSCEVRTSTWLALDRSIKCLPCLDHHG